MNRVVEITVNGEDLKLDLDDVMVIVDPEEDRLKVAADIAWWGEIWARAVEAAEFADSTYRNWSAGSMNNAVDPATGKAPAEWKVKAIVEGSKEFLAHKKLIAAANGNVVRAKAVYEAFCHKAELLRQRTRQESNESYHANQLGRGRPDHEGDTADDPRAKTMAKHNQKNRK